MDESTHEPTLKTLLAAGNALLQPPDPLPSAPSALVGRLRSSGELLPWREKPGWGEDDELEEIGDDDSEADAVKRRDRRDALVLLVGQRCLDILLAMQDWLSKEFWPVEHKGGLGEKDFLLGTADSRLLRLMLQHAIVSYLLPLTLSYVASLRRGQSADGATKLGNAVEALLSLTETRDPPSGKSATLTPHTSISQTLLATHLTPILLAGITLGWTPTAPPAQHQQLRSRLIHTLTSLSPTQAMAALSIALKIVQGGKRKPPSGWSRTWPSYVESTLGWLLSTTVMRPGGVRAVMENVFGEAGNIGGAEGVEGPKLDQIAGLLARVPRTSTPEAYIPYLLKELFALIGPESASHPMVYTHAAAYVVHHLWSTSAPGARPWLEQHLHNPLRPTRPPEGVVLPPDRVSELLQTEAQLVLHAPPSPDFINFVVGPVLPQLFALYAVVDPAQQPKTLEKASADAPGLGADVKLLLTSWGKVVDKDQGVAGVWKIVKGGRGWPVSEDGQVLHWRKEGASAELVYSDPSLVEQASQVEAPQIDTMDLDEDSGAGVLDQLDLAPSPPLLARLLKEFDRPDISSEVFLKVINQWRVLSGADDQNPLDTLLFLRLTLAMMETLGDKIMRNPEHVLSFVEGVLKDEAEAIAERKKNKPLVEEVDSGDKDDDEPLPELTAEGVEKMGLVETAISLLLASLEANDKLNHATAAILHPINDHLEALTLSPSASVRQLAREAQLVLLVRRSDALESTDGKVSEGVATYRRALTLVSDPILPVRAHGLVLLRDLVLSNDYDAALTPSILDVYMQAIQDKDSYIYLNAVKGLAAMASALGRDIFRTLVRVYRGDGDMAEGDKLDRSLRVGEALGLVIRRAGKAFAANAELIVPTLLAIFRDTRAPTILRTSALSLLSTCAEVDHLALLPWANELAGGAVDLVQVESVRSSPFRPEQKAQAEPQPKPKVMLVDDEEPEPEPAAATDAAPRIVDAEPTGQDSKHPALRRAAVVFLGLLAASLIEAADDAPQQDSDEFKMRLPGDAAPSAPPNVRIDPAALNRAATVLGYVAHTDDDEVVRGQATEVVALVDRLKSLQAIQAAGRAGVPPAEIRAPSAAGKREFLP